jgi:hypothetical protein
MEIGESRFEAASEKKIARLYLKKQAGHGGVCL